MSENTFAVPELHSRSYSWEKRMDVVAKYMLLGNMRVVSEQTGVNYATLMDWKKSDWWPDMVDQIRRQKKTKTSDSITKIIEGSLEVLQDRLENGDWVLNNKTGEIIRKPVGVKDAATIANQLMQRQLQLEDLIERNSKSSDTVQETLVALATEFAKWQKKNKKEIIDVEDANALYDQRKTGLQEGSGEVYIPSGSSEETS